MSYIRFKQDGPLVTLMMSSKCESVNGKAAIQMGKTLIALGKKAQEIEEVDRIIHDGAIINRAGLPFGITDHPKIKDEIHKEAQYNRELRRYMVPSIKSGEVFGAPTIKGGQHG